MRCIYTAVPSRGPMVGVDHVLDLGPCKFPNEGMDAVHLFEKVLTARGYKFPLRCWESTVSNALFSFWEKVLVIPGPQKRNCCNGFVSAGSLSLCYGQSVAKTVFEAQAFGAFKMKFGGVSLMSIGLPPCTKFTIWRMHRSTLHLGTCRVGYSLQLAYVFWSALAIGCYARPVHPSTCSQWQTCMGPIYFHLNWSEFRRMSRSWASAFTLAKLAWSQCPSFSTLHTRCSITYAGPNARKCGRSLSSTHGHEPSRS